MAAFPAAFFIPCGQPNTERSPLPALTVFLLLAGEHLEEGEWVEKTRVQTSGSGRPPEVFFCDIAVLSTKVAGPFLYGVSCEIYTHFTVGQRDRCKPTVTTDLHIETAPEGGSDMGRIGYGYVSSDTTYDVLLFCG